MVHPAYPDKLLEILGNKLWAIVRYHPRPGFRILLLGTLQDDLYIPACRQAGASVMDSRISQ